MWNPGNTEDGVESALNYLKRQRHKMMLYTMYSEYEKYERIIRHPPEKMCLVGSSVTA